MLILTSQQQENWENRNGPDLVQAFPKKWWVDSDYYRLKGSGCHYNTILNNNGTN
jgi:hypothetical protein